MILSAARQIQNRHHALDAFFNEKWLLVFSFVSSPKTSNWSLWLVASFMRKHLSSRNPPNPPILVSLFCHRWRSFEMKVQNPHASWSLVVLSVNFLGSLFELYTPIFGRHYEVRSRRVGIGDAQMGAKTMLPGKGKAGTKNQTTNRLAQAGSLMRLGVLLLHPLESFGIKKSRITDHHFRKIKISWTASGWTSGKSSTCWSFPIETEFPPSEQIAVRRCGALSMNSMEKVKGLDLENPLVIFVGRLNPFNLKLSGIM